LPTRRRQRVFERDGDGGIKRWQFAAKRNLQNRARPRPVFPAAASLWLLAAVKWHATEVFFSAALNEEPSVMVRVLLVHLCTILVVLENGQKRQIILFLLFNSKYQKP
jgi:hypothetical protein